MRILTHTVTAAEDGQTAKQLLRSLWHISGSLLSRLKFRDAITANGVPVPVNHILRAGDVLRADVSDLPGEHPHILPVDYPLAILYEDEDLLLLDKPAGIAIHPAALTEETVTVAGSVVHYLGQDSFHCVNRLDRGTTGAMVVAKTGYMHARCMALLHSGDFYREYRGVCLGQPQPPAGEITLPIGRDPSSVLRRRIDPEGLRGILVTHDHTDHISGVRVLAKQLRLPIYATAGTLESLAGTVEAGTQLIPLEEEQEIAGMGISPFATQHDAPDSCGFRIEAGSRTIGFATDLGAVTATVWAHLLGCHLAVLESNYEDSVLMNCTYPYYLKQRILGECGHLSNETAAEFAVECVRAGTSDILLAHLSDENNSPQLAEYTVGRALQSSGLSVRLAAAPRDTISEVHICRRSPSFASEN